MLQALGSASYVFRHETGGTICYGHWVLCLVLSDTRHGVSFITGIGFCILCYQTPDRGYDLLRALGSASCVIRHQAGVRFVTGIGFCILCSQTPDRGYDLLRALGSASYVIRHETGGTICYGHWVLHLVLADTRQGVRFVMGIGFCILCFQTRDRGTICYGHWFCILCYQTRDRGHDLLRALASTSCDIRHQTEGRICYGIGFCILCYQSRDRGYDLLRALGSASCVIRHQTGGTICDRHWNLHLVISDTRQGVRFVTGVGFCILCYQSRDRGYDLLRALGSASCVIRHETWGTICSGHWVLHLVSSDMRQGVRFVTGIGFCILCYQARDRGYDLLRASGSASYVIRHETGVTICYGHWVLHLVLSDTRQGLRFVTGLGFCILCHQTQDSGYDLLRALGSASCVIRHETGGTIYYGHWVLHLVLSDTRQGVRFVTGIVFCILCYQTRDRGTICDGHWVLHLVLSDTRQGV